MFRSTRNIRILGRACFAVPLATLALASPALADNPLIQGSYEPASDPIQAGCAGDAETLAMTRLSTSDANVYRESGDRLEVRYSPTCDMYWARALFVSSGNSYSYRVGIEQQQIPLGTEYDSQGAAMDTVYSAPQAAEWTSGLPGGYYTDMVSSEAPQSGGKQTCVSAYGDIRAIEVGPDGSDQSLLSGQTTCVNVHWNS